MDEVYENKKKLRANYPVIVEFKKNYNNEKYMIYSYKPDYTKPKKTSYYQCIKIEN